MTMKRRDFLSYSAATAAGMLAYGGCATSGSPDGTVYDMVVYGASSAGIAAAVQAARHGRSVILVEPSNHLGGLTTGGLGKTDSGNAAAIGGLSREFYQRIRRHYERSGTWVHETREAFMELGPNGRNSALAADGDAQWAFEPHAAKAVYEAMLAEAGVPVVMEDKLILKRGAGVRMNGDRIEAIVTEAGNVYRGRIFVDATYEGDLVAMAGVSYHVGREANSVYGEQLNGVQSRWSVNHIFLKNVDPYVVPGDRSSGLLPDIHDGDPGVDGEGDHRVQAYCYRMCLCDAPENRVPFHRPDDYNEARYELLFRNFEAGDDRMPWLPGRMPNRKTDTNNRWAVSTNLIGANYAYPDGDYGTRAAILAEHESYQRGLMWTLAYHPRTPQWVRDTVSPFGLAKDEFTDNANWPTQIYVREARRMIGAYVHTEDDCRRLRVAEDSVGLGSYNMDSHSVQRHVTAEGFAQNEGNLEYSPGGPYVISYRSLTPKRQECANLLACCNAVSSSHIAFGSIRMEPVFMILGQSAASAAHLALQGDRAVQDVPYRELRPFLIEGGQRLDVDLAAYPPFPFTGKRYRDDPDPA